jgi:two-component system, NtrC family, response regulator HydG
MFSALIGQSPNFEALVRNARMIASTDVTVLICGETGTGKEILANALRQQSPRTEGPFVALNCAALPETLAESELFGYRKGSFTGAQSSQIGRLQAADGGTLFLDEVNSLPVPLQAKLLRFLESGEIQPIGETITQRVDVRVIAATNVDLHEKTVRGEFRRDLYYRLNVVPLEIPPLRDRGGDILLLLNHFMQQFADVHNLPPPSFSKGALACMCAYAWPGNVRELRNLCERLSILMAGRVIEENNLPTEISLQVPQLRSLFHLPELGVNLEQIEVDLIRQALQRTNGNRSRSARLLGISRDTLLYRMQKHGLE